MIIAHPLSRFLKRFSAGLAALILCMSLVALTAVFLQRYEVTQFRLEVGRSIDAVSTLSLQLADAQNAMMLAASTDGSWWSRIAEDSIVTLRTAMDDLADVPDVTGNPETTEKARARLDAWLAAADDVLAGDGMAQSVATVEYPRARESLITISEELQVARTERRIRHDTLILINASGIVAATVAALALVAALSRRYVRRLTTPLNQLRGMVDARVGGDFAVRARTDQGFSEAVLLAGAINQLSDANDALRAAQDATIRGHRLAERVAAQLATAGEERDPLESALDTLREGLGLDAVALQPLDNGPGTQTRVVPPDADLAWLEAPMPAADQSPPGHPGDVVAVPLELGGQSMGTLLARRTREPWVSSDVDALELCSHHLAAWLALQTVIRTTRQLDADKTRFLSTTSHELRTPLTAVVAWLSMFEEGDLGELTDEQQHAMGVVERNIARLRDLIEDLLTVNQLDSGQARAVRTRMDVTALTRRVVESLTPMAVRAGIDLACESQPCHLSGNVQGDPGQIERAIVNVTQNALKFTEPGGRVELQVSCRDTDITLTCTDTGIGIPNDDLPHVLERFRRADNAHGLPGTGLGLSIVDSIMEAHGGTFTLNSTEGVGTTVVLTLPSQVPSTSGALG